MLHIFYQKHAEDFNYNQQHYIKELQNDKKHLNVLLIVRNLELLSISAISP